MTMNKPTRMFLILMLMIIMIFTSASLSHLNDVNKPLIEILRWIFYFSSAAFLFGDEIENSFKEDKNDR